MTSSIDTLRARLRQLQQRHDGGELSAERYAEARAPLERELLALVMAGPHEGAGAAAAMAPPAQAVAPLLATATPSASPTSAASAAPAGAAPAVTQPQPRPSKRLWAAVLGSIVLLAALGYGLTGSPELALRGNAPSAVAQAPEGDEGAPVTEEQVRAMVDKLAQRLQESPDDVVGWTMLGRAYGVMGRSADAVQAFRRALALAPQDPGLMADLADALAAQNKGQLAGEPTQLVQRALQIDPGNLKALALSGSAAFDRRDYASAVRQWEQVRSALPPDSAFLAQVDASIAQARELGGLPPAGTGGNANASAAPASASGGPTAQHAATAVSGTLSLAPALQAKAAADDTVFIVARPADGSRMPLAVLRKQVRDLPLQFTLDDSLAMAPTARLSDHQQVVVAARISKSGNAMPQAGDLSGESAPVAPGASGLRIEIDREVEGATAR